MHQPASGPYHQPPMQVADIPPEYPAVYDMLSTGDAIGVFQVESRAQLAMLPRLLPKTYYDLVVEVAIGRPGPIQGDMVHPYLRRRDGIEAQEPQPKEIAAVLDRTLGVPIFQEQVIQLVMVAAGFSAGEADALRRAMATWKGGQGLSHFHERIIQGMRDRGHHPEFASRLCHQIEGFGKYGFPESHAASFALLVYISTWLICHMRAAFYCGLLNAQPMGFYTPSQLLQDAARHDITILPI
jgi:DNA polymerase III, alpha subunit